MSNIKLYASLNQNGRIINKDVREMFKLSNEGALKEVKKLIKSEIIESEGKGRALQHVFEQGWRISWRYDWQFDGIE